MCNYLCLHSTFYNFDLLIVLLMQTVTGRRTISYRPEYVPSTECSYC